MSGISGHSSRSSSMKDYQASDKAQTELRGLLKEKGKLEKQLKEFQKRDAKSKWYRSKVGTTAKKDQPKSLPSLNAGSVDIRTLFSMKSTTAEKPTTSETTAVAEAAEETTATERDDSRPICQNERYESQGEDEVLVTRPGNTAEDEGEAHEEIQNPTDEESFLAYSSPICSN